MSMPYEQREELRIEITRQLRVLVNRAHGLGLVVQIESHLTPKGEVGGRWYDIDVRHGRGFYPPETKA